MSLPIFKDDSQAFMLMQTAWAKDIDPVIANPIAQGIIIPGVVLASGANTINHKLGRTLQGWIVVRQSASATFYDSQATNPRPDKTLVLNASGAATINLYVF